MFINPQYIPGLQAIARVELWFSSSRKVFITVTLAVTSYVAQSLWFGKLLATARVHKQIWTGHALCLR